MNTNRLHRRLFREPAARSAARRAFEENVQCIDMMMHLIGELGHGDFGDWSHLTDQCARVWLRYQAEVESIAAEHGMTVSEVLGDLPRWPDPAVLETYAGRSKPPAGWTFIRRATPGSDSSPSGDNSRISPERR